MPLPYGARDPFDLPKVERWVHTITDKDLWSLAMAMMRKSSEDEAAWPIERMDTFIRDGRAAGIDVPREIADRMYCWRKS